MTLSSSPRDCTCSPSMHVFNWFQTSHFTSITYRLRAQEVVDRCPEAGVYVLCFSTTALYVGLLLFNALIDSCGMLSKCWIVHDVHAGLS